MSENSENSFLTRIKKLVGLESKPTTQAIPMATPELPGLISSQARPMTPEEDLAQLADWRGPKGREIIRAESVARQAINRKKTRVMNTVAALGTAVGMAGTGLAANSPTVGEALNNAAKNVAQKIDDLAKPDPGVIQSNISKKALDNRPNLTMPDPSNPIPDTGPFPLGKPQKT